MNRLFLILLLSISIKLNELIFRLINWIQKKENEEIKTLDI